MYRRRTSTFETIAMLKRKVTKKEKESNGLISCRLVVVLQERDFVSLGSDSVSIVPQL